ncbi:hypothetical protein TRFO_04195 [Tritrichomonas foetus]|uniref:Uncharacterized protein n=1 Tax=Tritrichomonas foetus TaxID=1144522 RepID=A0A1J4KIA9_9EUKA|nr:hypothetical protein TRFO_04195 [Tritrichomonas foetus]|eukprot:OHT10680.1 hypothetical protein TRFO_04195 [Tritrichomonas foetus]
MQFGNEQTHLCGLHPAACNAGEADLVNVFVNGVPVRINPLESLLTIESLFGMKNMRFISNGRLLSNALSLKFNQINDGDQIIALYPKDFQKPQQQTFSSSGLNKATNQTIISGSKLNNPNNGKFAEKKFRERFEKNWANKFNDPDSIYEQLLDATDPRTSSESARLSDLFRMRVENSPSAYRKVCSKFGDDHQRTGARKKATATVIPEKSFSPSTELLPEMWIHNATSPNNGTTSASVC